jgi:hypothetical protein
MILSFWDYDNDGVYDSREVAAADSPAPTSTGGAR